MSNKAGDGGKSGKDDPTKEKSKISTIVDAVSKLAAAAAIVFGAFIANTYQSKMSSINIINQREQAESQLRADMFGSLIGPIVGPYTNGEKTEPERERLLVAMLALNFHEHFEFKPLLEYVDERLNEELGQKEAKKETDSLRSIARRVKDRQIALLIREGADSPYNLLWDYIPENDPRKTDGTYTGKPDKSRNVKAWISDDSRQPVQIVSPSQNWTLNIFIVEIDWNKQNVGVRMNIMGKSDTSGRYIDIPMKFTLTGYDFPLTDNTALPDGDRFSLAIHSMNQMEKSIVLKLIWFPKDFFTPRERPIDYRQFLEKLGIRTEKTAGTEQK